MTENLDIHILYCDKDAHYLVDIFEKCQNFKITNAANDWKINVYTHDNTGKNNIGQFQRRLEIIKSTPKNNFIWFVDVDDDIVNDADLLNIDTIEENIDCITFSFMTNFCNAEDMTILPHWVRQIRENIIVDPKKVYPETSPLGRLTMSDLVSGCLWNKWVRASCFEGIEDYLKGIECESMRPNGSEDLFYTYYMLTKARHLYYNLASPIYFYHCERSLIFNDTKYISYENFKRFRNDHSLVDKAILGLDISEKMKKDYIRDDLICHLSKALICKDIKKALAEIKDCYGAENTIKCLFVHGQKFRLRHSYVKYLAYCYLSGHFDR